MDQKTAQRIEKLRKVSPRVSEVCENLIALDPSSGEQITRASNWFLVFTMVQNPPPEGISPLTRELYRVMLRECLLEICQSAETAGFHKNILTPILRAGQSDLADFTRSLHD